MRSTPRGFPILPSKRFILRPPASKDAENALLSIAEVTRFSNHAPSKEQSQRLVTWMSKLYTSGKGCAWIIEDRAANLIGAIRYNSFEKKWKCGEIGYELHPDFWGKGLMSEAVGLIVICGHQTFGLNRIEAWTLPGNAASDRVLEKSGFRYEGTLRQKAWFKSAYHDFRMFGRLAGDPAN
jgi:ribosomal-protein-alanine N-acetyltransferase